MRRNTYTKPQTATIEDRQNQIALFGLVFGFSFFLSLVYWGI